MGGSLDRGWRLALPAAAWLAGSGLQLQRAALMPADVAMALAAAGLLLAWGLRRHLPWLCLALALAAFGSTELRAAWRLADGLAPALEGRDLQLEGRVTGLPQPGPLGTRFVFEVDAARLDGLPAAVPRQVSLTWPAAAGVEPRAGQRWRLAARLKRPHGARNPHGFDLELWLFERGLGATGSVRPDAPALMLATADGAAVDRLRQQLREAIFARVPDARAAGVLAALVVGDQGAIDQADWDLFRDTGTAHLVSISGLHVTMFAWLAAALVGRLWRRSARLPLLWPAPLAACWGGLALAAAYALLAGWGVPAQRTLWMLAAVAAAQTAGLRWPGPFVLLAAALAVALADPWALLQPGFWLSFGAVALLMLGAAPTGPATDAGVGVGRRAAGVVGVAGVVKGGVRTQAVASVGLAPLTLLCFGQVSTAGFLANLVAIPAVTLLVTPLALAGVLLPPAWPLAAAVLDVLVALLRPLAALPAWTAAAPPAWAAAAGLLGGALLVLRLPWSLRLLGLPLLLPLLAPRPPLPPVGRFELVAMDVGQGSALLLRTRRHLLVYDTGPRWSSESDAGDRLLLPLLRARGETRVHRLVLSHRDTDHVGGAASLIAGLPVDAISSSLEPGHPLRAAGVPHADCVAGEHWTWDGVRFEILHPPQGLAAEAKPNTRSCVLRVADAQGRSVLLPGDLEAAQEAALALGDRQALASDVLVVPHHGSRTSSSAVFLDAVGPRIAVVQAGYRSRFGHPAPDVLARYAERGIAVVRTDACGAWTWSGAGVGRCTREAGRRYWHHRASTEE